MIEPLFCLFGQVCRLHPGLFHQTTSFSVSQYLTLLTVCLCNTSFAFQNTVNINFFTNCCLEFSRVSDDGWLQVVESILSLDYCDSSSSQHSWPYALESLHQPFSKSWKEMSIHWNLYSSFNCLGTEQHDTFKYPNFSWRR